MAASKKTIDHREIQRWVESHGGHPATVETTRSKKDVGLIRIDFPGFSGEGSLVPVEWDEWFRKFDEQELAFVYQDGKNTNFNKLVRRDPEKPRASERARRTSSAVSGGSRKRMSRKTSSERRQRTLPSSKPAAARRGASAKRPPAKAARGSRRGGQPELSGLTKAELYQMARSAGLAQRATMNKPQLIRALEREQEQKR